MGWDDSTWQNIASAELFVLDPAASAPTWQDLTLSSSGSLPPARGFHGAAVLNNKVLICMGLDMNTQNFVKGDLASSKTEFLTSCEECTLNYYANYSCWRLEQYSIGISLMLAIQRIKQENM